MKRLAYLVALGVAVTLAVADAAAAGPTITYSVTSGSAGDNGWYLSNVTVAVQVQSATQTTCLSVYTFTAASDSVDCTASDPPLSSSIHLQFKIDKAAPSVTPTTERAPDGGGWFNHAVNVVFAGADSGSGVAGCTTVAYAGPDSPSASVAGTCRDVAGNVSAPVAFGLKYDATAPVVSAAASRASDANGWFNHPVDVAFTGSDATSGIAACTPATTYTGPDSVSASPVGTCRDAAGNAGTAGLALKFDATAPSIAAKPGRPADANGWYNHPVEVGFSGSDATAGIGSCSQPVTYSRPEGATAAVPGTCSDAAGNSASTSFTLRYDSTAPRLADLSVELGNGSAVLRWKAPPDLTDVAVERSPGRGGASASSVFKGRASAFRDAQLRNGVHYRYTLRSLDGAGNAASTVVVVSPRALYAPKPGVRARAGTVLRWSPVRGASYYNVQLYRSGRKVLTWWPTGPQYRLSSHWRYAGATIRLQPGRYRWYVWPGRGAPSTRRYGPLLGSSAFVVR